MSAMQNKRDQAIMNWVRIHRPDIERQVEPFLDNEAIYTLMSIAFEAGREFQKANPNAVNGPADYL